MNDIFDVPTMDLDQDSPFANDPFAFRTYQVRVTAEGEAYKGLPILKLEADGTAISRTEVLEGTNEYVFTFDAIVVDEFSFSFINDAWGGTADTDRNLHIKNIEINGVDVNDGTSFFRKGTLDIDITDLEVEMFEPDADGNLFEPVDLSELDQEPGTPDVRPEPEDIVPGGEYLDAAGSDPDQAHWITLSVSADTYRGNARMEFETYDNGKTVKSIGEDTETFAFLVQEDDPSFSIAFTNDKWGGTAETDRNLIIHDLFINGEKADDGHVFYRNGEKEYDLSGYTPVDVDMVRQEFEFDSIVLEEFI